MMFGGWRGLRLIRSGLVNQGCAGLLYFGTPFVGFTTGLQVRAKAYY
jgi:hypothetical protein